MADFAFQFLEELQATTSVLASVTRASWLNSCAFQYLAGHLSIPSHKRVYHKGYLAQAYCSHWQVCPKATLPQRPCSFFSKARPQYSQRQGYSIRATLDPFWFKTARQMVTAEAAHDVLKVAYVVRPRPRSPVPRLPPRPVSHFSSWKNFESP